MKRFLDKIGVTDVRNILGIVSVLGCLIVVILLLFKQIPAGNNDVLNVAIGFLFGNLVSPVSGDFFGSSKDKKDEPKA